MKLLADSDEIREELKRLSPDLIAVAYIGKDWDVYINPSMVERICFAPVPGTNREAALQVINKIGLSNIELLENLHTKIYYNSRTNKGIVGSANLSNNGLSSLGNEEIAFIVLDDDKSLLKRIYELFEKARDKYPNNSQKQEIIESIKPPSTQAPFVSPVIDCIKKGPFPAGERVQIRASDVKEAIELYSDIETDRGNLAVRLGVNMADLYKKFGNEIKDIYVEVEHLETNAQDRLNKLLDREIDGFIQLKIGNLSGKACGTQFRVDGFSNSTYVKYVNVSKSSWEKDRYFKF